MAGFTKLDNALLQRILTSDLTKRQLKILFLITRFSYGYQKTYAVLRRNDFSYAGVSPQCIRCELKKLVRRRVIIWNPENDTVRINLSLGEWTVKRTVEKPGDNLRRYFKIATKNSMKQQLSIYRNSNIDLAETATHSKETKRNIEKENRFLQVIREYFLNVSPLNQSELQMLRQIFERHPSKDIGDAIVRVSQSGDRSFGHFLKVLDRETSPIKGRHLTSIKRGIQRFWGRLPRS